MKRIHYAGDTELTGSAIADAVLAYSEALANGDAAASVDIPVRMDDGRIDRVSLLIGPASQMTAVPEDNEYEEIVDDELVEDFYRRARLLSKDVAPAQDQGPPPEIPDLDYPEH